MGKRKVKLDELHDARVSFLSLVDAGANRAPWKIQKSEEGGIEPMLHFREIFKDETFEPSVLAVAVAPEADLDAVKIVVEKAGLKTDIQKDIDGAVVFVQGEGALENIRGQAVKVRLAEKLCVVCDVQKSFSPWIGSTDFTTNLKGQGLLPNFELAADALRTTIFEALGEAEGRKQAASSVQKAAEDFAQHLSTLVKDLPEEVFKLEVAVNESDCAMFAAPPSDEHAKPTDTGSSPDADPTPGEQVVKGEGDEEREQVEKQGSPGASEVDGKSDQEFASGDGVAAGAGGSVDSPTDSSLPEGKASVAGVTKDEVAALLADALKPILESIDAVKAQAAEAVQKAETLDKELGMSVLGEAQGDGEGRQEVRFTEPPLIDTGMQSLDLD